MGDTSPGGEAPNNAAPRIDRPDPAGAMDLAAISRLLAADGADPTLRRGRRSSGAGPPVESYTVVPSARDPRLLLPTGSRRHAVVAARMVNRPTDWRARLRQYATRACFAAGLGERVFRDRLVPAAPATLVRHLAEVLDRPVCAALRLGPARANQKPVLVLLDPAARVVGYVKIATGPLTRRLLAVERAALTTLASADLRVLTVPRIRHAGRWRETELLVVSALPTRRARSAATGRAAGVVAAAAAELARVRPTVVAPLSGSGYLDRLARRVAALPADRHRALLDDLLTQLTAGDPWLEYGDWHGDWFPGNQAVAGGRLLVWDWERYAAGVPVGFDPLHHAFMTALLVRRRPLPEAADRMARAASRLLAPLGVPADRAAAVAALYLVEIATRYREDRNHAVGGALARPAQWLAPAVARLGLRRSDQMEPDRGGADARG